MEPLCFQKMHGSGNDFILIDNRSGAVAAPDGPDLARTLCTRKFGVGADGLILIETSSSADFRWRFFNADGSEAEMCGNGGRCAARFAAVSGISGPELCFETLAGIIHASVTGTRVKLELSQPRDLALDLSLPLESGTLVAHHINTGVPHTVLFTRDLSGAPVSSQGQEIRNAKAFQPAGTNVNFVQTSDEGDISIRTYERGVEDETMACGTGAVASAIVSALKGFSTSPVKVTTSGGELLKVYFTLQGETVRDVFLEGETVHVYSGQLNGDL